MRLTLKVIAIFLAFGIFPLVIIGGIMENAITGIENRTIKHFEVAARTLADNIDRNLFERYGDVQAFSFNHVVSLKDSHVSFWYQSGEESEIVTTMNGYVQTYGIYYLTILVDLDGRVIAVNSRDAQNRPIDSEWIYQKNYSDSEWFRALVKGRFTTHMPFTAPDNDRSTGTFIEDLHVDEDVKRAYPGDDGLALGFSAPVYEDDKLIAYWSNRTKFSLVENLFQDTYREMKKNSFPGTELTLLDAAGCVIIDFDPVRVGTEEIIHDFDVLMNLDLGSSGVSAAQQAVAGQTGHMWSFHARKQIVQAAGFAHLRGARGYPGMNWSVLVRTPRSEALVELAEIYQQVFVVVGICLLLIVFLGIAVGRFSVKPLVDMTEAAKRFAAGDTGVRVEIRSTDEIGTLGAAFNEMIAQITRQRERLEENNRLLTAFQQIGGITLAPLDMEKILDNLARQILEAGIFHSIMIALVDERKQSVTAVRSLVRMDENGRAGGDVSVVQNEIDVGYSLDDDNITAQVARTGEMQVLTEWDERLDPRFNDPQERRGQVAYFIPIKRGDHPLAVLGTGSREAEKEEMLRRIAAMQPLLDLVGIALEHSRLYQELRDSEEQLRQSQKMQAVGELTAGIAHNFNNLLMGILNSLEEARLDGVGDSTLLQEAETNTLHAAEMIAQLMLFSRPDRPDELQPVKISRVVQEAIAICSKTFDRKIVIHQEIPEDLPPIVGDANQLGQVFLNLLLNARDALEGGNSSTPCIRIEANLFDGSRESMSLPAKVLPRNYLRLKISDNGMGMDKETRKRIFEPFFTTKEKDKGTGLGLATVYAIIREHEGWIECDSQPGAGTCFFVYLPTAVEEQEATPVIEAEPSMPRGEETILVIEDEDLVRQRLMSMLERHGYTVLAGADGEEGLRVFEQHRADIDLVLLDLSMPRLSGQEVLAQLRELEPEIRVIISTGYAHREDTLGVQALLKKPYRMSRALQTIRQVLNAR